MKVLLAGETLNGSANYLMAVFRRLSAEVTHISPEKILHPRRLRRQFDAIIFSDFSKANTPESSQKLIMEQIECGTGFMMIGGWASFSGPFGRWEGSLIEKILPVNCLKKDDRINFPSGALVIQNQKHPVLKKNLLNHPPIICGLNQILPKKNSVTVLCAKKIVSGKNGACLFLDSKKYPLLVIDPDPRKRIAAFSSDFAPHWCGGLLDWGGNSEKIKVNSKSTVEVGKSYIQFISSLILWLSKSNH